MRPNRPVGPPPDRDDGPDWVEETPPSDRLSPCAVLEALAIQIGADPDRLERALRALLRGVA